MLYATGEGLTHPAGSDGKLATAPFPTPVLPVTLTGIQPRFSSPARLPDFYRSTPACPWFRAHRQCGRRAQRWGRVESTRCDDRSSRI